MDAVEMIQSMGAVAMVCVGAAAVMVSLLAMAFARSGMGSWRTYFDSMTELAGWAVAIYAIFSVGGTMGFLGLGPLR
jgi:hypothetical protein